MMRVTSTAPSAEPRVERRETEHVAATSESTLALDRVAMGLRGARARTGLTEADVVSILARQGIALSVSGLCRAESTGSMTLALAACLADIYGTTTDALAGRRLYCKRPSLDDFPVG